MMDYTILMPCLNEAATVAHCIGQARESIARLGLDAEILIADNGSDDGSAEIAREQGAAVVTVAAKGYGAALQGGIRAARGDSIIMGDADGSYAFDQLDPFVEALRGGADLVVGDRFRGGIEPGAMPWSHRWGVAVLSALGRWRFKTNVHDFHCGLRGFDRRKALALELRCPGMEFATELIARFARSGACIRQVPTPLRNDLRGRPPHLRTVRDGFRHLYYLLFEKPIPEKKRRNKR